MNVAFKKDMTWNRMNNCYFAINCVDIPFVIYYLLLYNNLPQNNNVWPWHLLWVHAILPAKGVWVETQVDSRQTPAKQKHKWIPSRWLSKSRVYYLKFRHVSFKKSLVKSLVCWLDLEESRLYATNTTKPTILFNCFQLVQINTCFLVMIFLIV